MSAVCGRCKEEEAVFECADCVGSKRRGELLPLCDACSALIHVGFLADHQVVSVAIKEQKKVFEEQLGKFKSFEKQLQLKLNEINYAKQDIEQRSQYNQQVVTQAFQAVWQALRQREKELAVPLRDGSRKKAALLTEYEKSISQATSEFQNICTNARKLLQGSSVDFAQQHEQMTKKLKEFEVCRVSSPFPTLGCPARLDVTDLLRSIKELCLPSVDDDKAPIDETASKEGEVDKDPSREAQSKTAPELQAPKEGDMIQVYVESRMDAKGRFWVSRNLSEDTANLYENLSFRIRQDIVQSPLAQVEIEEGMLCCGQFQEDHRWYRGRVEQLKRDKGLARIRWLDYAHDNDVPLAAVQPLKEEFQTLPFQALECCLFEHLDEDLPHPARWEFSDHTANTLLHCTILRQMPQASPDEKSLVYLVDLKNSYKEVDIKERILEKADEAKSKRDTIMCRDIRYMKDYVPPVSKPTNAKKETTSEKAKEDETNKEAKSESRQDEAVDTNKNARANIETESKEAESTANKEDTATDETSGKSKDETVGNQAGGGRGDTVDEINKTKLNADKTEDVQSGLREMDAQRNTDHEGGERNTGLTRQDDSGDIQVEKLAPVEKIRGPGITDSAEDVPAGNEGTGHLDAGSGNISSSGKQKETENKVASTADGTISPSPGAVKILEREQGIPDQKEARGKQALNKEADTAVAEMSSRKKEDRSAESTGITTSGPETANSDNSSPPSSGQNKQPLDANPDRRQPKDYLPEPGDEDDEEGDDHGLIESLISQSDRVMAHNPDHALSGRGASSRGMPSYHESGAYHPYGGGGYRMAPGMFSGAQYPPLSLGLQPIASSSEVCAGGSVIEASKPDQSSSTGDGFKIVVGSSFSICVATPLSDNGRFWASRVRGPVQESQLRRLMHDISMPFEPLTLDRLKEVKVVCAQAESGQWCRAKVEGLVNNKVQVRYVDFGQADLVEEHRIKTLPVTYQLFPYQAMELSIATQQHTRFSNAAKEAFLRYTQGRVLSAKVVASDSKIVFVTLSCVDENQKVYDISSAVLNVNPETMPTDTGEKVKERLPASIESSLWGGHDEHNGGPVPEDYRSSDPHDTRYDSHQSDGRPHDRGSGDRCYVCNNFGHLSYDCPIKRGDARDRNRNKGGSKKNWGRRNRKY